MAEEKTEEKTDVKEEEVGEIVHFFGKISVAVVKITKGNLKVGDKVRIAGGETEVEQTVDSLQIDKEKVEEIKKGDEAGMKVEEKVREGYKVYKVVE